MVITFIICFVIVKLTLGYVMAQNLLVSTINTSFFSLHVKYQTTGSFGLAIAQYVCLHEIASQVVKSTKRWSQKMTSLNELFFGLNRNSLSSFVTKATKLVAVCTGVPNVLNIDSLIRVFSQ
jgi:hypothetical protein